MGKESYIAPVLRFARSLKDHFGDVYANTFFRWTLFWIPLVVILFRAALPLRRLNRLLLHCTHPSLLESLNEDEEAIVAFFHPYCDKGGGGERVLWLVCKIG